MKEIKKIDFDIITYIKFKNKLIVKIKDKKTQLDNKYIYEYFDKNLNLYYYLNYKYCYPSNKVNNKDFKQVYLTRGKIITEYTNILVFSIIKESEKQIDPRLLHLNMFTKVIDDNDYYSSIPLVNEISHIDNFIGVKSCISVCYELNKKDNKWDKFLLSYKTNTCCENKIISASKGHTKK